MQSFNPEKSESPKEGKLIKFPERRKPELVAAEKREEILNEPLVLANKILDLEEELAIMEGVLEKPEKIKKKKIKQTKDAATPVTEEELYRVQLLRHELEGEKRNLQREYNLIVATLPAEEKSELKKITFDLESSRRSLGHLLPEKELGSEKWKDGDLVWEENIKYFDKNYDRFWSHPDGVLFEDANVNSLSLNGKFLCNPDRFDIYFGNYGEKFERGSLGGVIVPNQKGNKLILNGKTVIYKGKFDQWQPHPEGVVIKRGDEFLLNGKSLLYRGKCDKWYPHPQGVIIKIGDKFLLNGQELLYEGRTDGIINLLEGVVIERDNKLFLNGKELIFEGAWEGIGTSGHGVVIQENGWLNFNGKRFVRLGLVDGMYPAWLAHKDGVFVREERKDGAREWRFYSFDREVKQDE